MRFGILVVVGLGKVESGAEVDIRAGGGVQSMSFEPPPRGRPLRSFGHESFLELTDTQQSLWRQQTSRCVVEDLGWPEPIQFGT